MSHHSPQLGGRLGRVPRPQELGTMAGSERNVGPGLPPVPSGPRTRDGNPGGTEDKTLGGSKAWDRGQNASRVVGGGWGKGQLRMPISSFLHPLNFLKP